MRGRFERVFGLAVHAGFNLSLVISVFLLLGVLALDLHTAWIDWAKLGLGLVLALEGFLLALDWHGARRLTLSRIRGGGAKGGSLKGRILWSLASPALEALGIAWVLAGLLAVGLGVTGIV